jgi:hypothetical protein
MVLSIFHHFQMLVERRFLHKIKSIQIDWGGEYHKLNSFKLICPYTHEQNDTIERHHRHIVKTVITLLRQCSAPLRFWNYVFESSVYLINHNHTLVLQN